MRNLNYELKQLCLRNRDGSFATQSNRRYMLSQIANDLHSLGYRKLKAVNLRTKHIQALVKHWQTRGLSTATIKNRMSNIRWWAQKVHKSDVVPINKDLGIPDRQYQTKIDKAKTLETERLSRIKDPYVKMSLKLQAAFGLRREESIKIMPTIADRTDNLWLKSSWTKGGKERSIPIETEIQRNTLDEAKRLSPNNALIQPGKQYIDQLRVYEKQTTAADIKKNHGLRHQYAQEQYKRLTGLEAPVKGGPSLKTMSSDTRELCDAARQIISHRLGHERVSIVNQYIGM